MGHVLSLFYLFRIFGYSYLYNAVLYCLISGLDLDLT